MKTLRPYQSDTVTKIFSEMQTGKKDFLAVMATGLGKSLFAVNVINKFPGHILWMTHEESLLSQSAIAILREEEFCTEELLNHLDSDVIEEKDDDDIFSSSGVDPETMRRYKEHIGVIKQKRFDIDAKILVASVQTLHRRLDKIPKDYFDCIVIDEADLFMSKTFVKCVDYFTPKLKLFLTATPFRLDGQSLKYLTENVVCDYDIKFGIDNGYLCELDAVRVKTNLNLDGVKTRAGEFAEEELAEFVDTPLRNRLVVNSYIKYAPGRPALMACVGVEHAMNLSQAFNDAGIISSFVVANKDLCPNRKERMSLWMDDEIKVMCHVNTLTAGVNYPNLACIGMVRPTKSKRYWLQNVGRITRTKDSEFKNGIILDFVDSTSKHTLINSWSLDEDKQLEDKVFIGKEKKKELIEKRDEARKAKVLGNVKKDERINLFKVPKMRENTSEKMQEPATEKQLAWIQRLGYDIVNNEYTKAMCSDIISTQPISEKQRWFLKAHNYDTAGEITIGMFGEAKSEIERRQTDAMRTAGRKVFFNDLK